MSFSEFITHPNRYTNLFNHNTEKNSVTDPAQQKQRNQLILTDSKNILT